MTLTTTMMMTTMSMTTTMMTNLVGQPEEEGLRLVVVVQDLHCLVREQVCGIHVFGLPRSSKTQEWRHAFCTIGLFISHDYVMEICVLRHRNDVTLFALLVYLYLPITSWKSVFWDKQRVCVLRHRNDVALLGILCVALRIVLQKIVQERAIRHVTYGYWFIDISRLRHGNLRSETLEWCHAFLRYWFIYISRLRHGNLCSETSKVNGLCVAPQEWPHAFWVLVKVNKERLRHGNLCVVLSCLVLSWYVA
jgi:hypothetical protein